MAKIRKAKKVFVCCGNYVAVDAGVPGRIYCPVCGKPLITPVNTPVTIVTQK